MRNNTTQAALFAIVALFSAGLPTQADPIEDLKQKAEADIKIASEKLKMKYLIALEKYQKALAAEGNLDGALAVKKETERASAASASAGLGKSGGGSSAKTGTAAGATITLSANKARLGNGTVLHKDSGLIKGWSRYGAFARWTLNDFKAGSYKVTLKYHAGNLGGGVLSIKTGRRTEKISIAGAGQWDEPRTYVLGRYYFSSPDHITIAALQGRSREMIYIDSIVLEPIK